MKDRSHGLSILGALPLNAVTKRISAVLGGCQSRSRRPDPTPCCRGRIVLPQSTEPSQQLQHIMFQAQCSRVNQQNVEKNAAKPSPLPALALSAVSLSPAP